jgi:3-hydroxyisobutyrate dehydrogenase-like beta-hydroxyacid dehydrogenase
LAGAAEAGSQVELETGAGVTANQGRADVARLHRFSRLKRPLKDFRLRDPDDRIATANIGVDRRTRDGAPTRSWRMHRMDLGFIGLGRMGSAVAENLLKAGHRLTVWNRSPGPAERLAAKGARAVRDPAQALRGEAAFSMLADDAAIRSVGLDGPLLESAAPGLVHANLATISLGFARELAAAHDAHGVGYVASPVFGRPDVAAAGKLTIALAGLPADIEALRPSFKAIAQKTVFVGEAPEMAILFKLAGNFMLATAIESLGEAFALLRKGGIDPTTFLDVITNRLFAGDVYRGYGAVMIEERNEPAGFALKLGRKDVNLALDAGHELAVPLPLVSLLGEHFEEALARGLGDKDLAALGSLIAEKAGLPTREAALTAEPRHEPGIG